MKPILRWSLCVSLCLLTGTTAPALAQLTIQSNPVFSTPTPAEQTLGPAPKPFEGEVVEFEPGEPPPPPADTGAATPPAPAAMERPQEIRLGDITLDGNRFTNTWWIKQHLKPLLEKQGQTVTVEALTKELQAINRFSKFKLKAVAVPDEAGGETDLRLEVYEQQPWQLVGTFDNQGRPGIGFYRGGAELINSNLLGFGDELSVQYVGADGSQFMKAGYKIPLNTKGGEFHVQYVRHDLDYDESLVTPRSKTLQLEGLDNVFYVTLSQPVGKKREWTPYISTLFREATIHRNNREIVNADPRPLTLGLRFNKADKYGRTNLDLQPYIVGRKWMGGDSEFVRARATLFRSLNLPRGNQLVFRGGWQYTDDELPVVQQFPIGGEYTVRGYTEGLITAEKGHFYSLEYHWPMPFVGDLVPQLKDRIRGLVFVDFGQSWIDRSSRRHLKGVSSRFENTSLLSVGFGFRWRATQYLQGFFDTGFGLLDRTAIELTGQPTARIHFGIRSELLPRPFRKHGDKQRLLSGETP